MQIFYETKEQKFYCRHMPGIVLTCDPHMHCDMEIAIIYNGKTFVEIGNKPSTTAESSDIIFVFPNQIHSFSSAQPEQHVLFTINPQLFPEYAQLFSDYLPDDNIIKGAARDPELRNLVDNIIRLYESKDSLYRDASLRGYLLAFISRIFSLTRLKKSNSEDMHAIGYIMNYCMANYNHALSLDILERELHLSKYYISHTINQKLGMSFNDYVNSIRVSSACRYLSEGKLSVQEISELVGFNTVRTFNRAFAKQMGTSPRDYRNRAEG